VDRRGFLELWLANILSDSISSAFLSRGFVYGDPIDVRDGVERWSVFTGHDRAATRRALDEIRAEKDAVIEVTSIREATEAGIRGTLPLGRLSERQREGSNSPAGGVTTPGPRRPRPRNWPPNSTSRPPRFTNTSTRRRRSSSTTRCRSSHTLRVGSGSTARKR